jgi:hypothetical protein
MTPASSVMFFKPEFDDFLYAPIGTENNDMPLSVLSALARLGIDPWEEASVLTGLSREEASRRLATIIDRIPNRRWREGELGAVVDRLIRLLPGVKLHRPSLPTPPTVQLNTKRLSAGATLLMLGICATILMLVFNGSS